MVERFLAAGAGFEAALFGQDGVAEEAGGVEVEGGEEGGGGKGVGGGVAEREAPAPLRSAANQASELGV